MNPPSLKGRVKSSAIPLTPVSLLLHRGMVRLKPIRVVRRPRPPRALMQGTQAAFWLVLVAAIGLGGAQAINGLPALVGIVLPPGIVAAQASDAPRVARLRLDVAGDLAASRYTPQVLSPVTAHPFPDWLKDKAPADAAPAAPPLPGPPRIAIVIDDLGADLASTDRALALAETRHAFVSAI